MANMDIRTEIKTANLKQWEVAYELGISHDSNFSRILRRELPLVEKERIRGAIERLKASKGN